MSAVTTFDADATALKTRILLPSMNLETTTERRVRERVRDALREEFGDDEAEVDAAIVSREIDAFLRTIPADAGAESAQQEEEDQRVEKRARDASANEPMSPTLLKRARAVHDVVPPGSPATAVSEDKLLSAVRALGEEGGDAKEIASFLKKDKSSVNKVLYALMKRGTVTQEVSAGNGGRPRWFIADNAGTMATVASSQATTVSARAATSSMPGNSVGGGGSVGRSASAQPGSSTVTAAPLDGVVPVQDEVIALSATKRVTVRKWNGNTLIDIREYYQPGGEGEYRPGKKGISLNVSQWSALKSVIDGAHDAFEQCESTGQEVVLGELSPMRRAVVSKYMGKIFLNIREYYEKNGVKLPGQKGVTLTKDLCERLVANKDHVSDRIASM